jgi:hypothetical protein
VTIGPYWLESGHRECDIHVPISDYPEKRPVADGFHSNGKDPQASRAGD